MTQKQKVGAKYNKVSALITREAAELIKTIGELPEIADKNIRLDDIVKQSTSLLAHDLIATDAKLHILRDAGILISRENFIHNRNICMPLALYRFLDSYRTIAKTSIQVLESKAEYIKACLNLDNVHIMV